MARRSTHVKSLSHDDNLLMIPPPGYKFIPKSEVICGKAGCFECFDIYCERCESKDRRIVELEMRNNDLVKYITQLQTKLFQDPSFTLRKDATSTAQSRKDVAIFPESPGPYGSPGMPSTGGEPFAFIQSPVLYDPSMNLSYIATTSFSPAPPDCVGWSGGPVNRAEKGADR